MESYLEDFLLDTCAFIWLLSHEKLSNEDREFILENPDRIYVTVVSIFEISLKLAKRPGSIQVGMEEGASIEDFFSGVIAELGFGIVDLEFRHMDLIKDMNVDHKDPFDRTIISQAICDDMIVVTSDSNFGLFAEYGLKLYEI